MSLAKSQPDRYFNLPRMKIPTFLLFPIALSAMEVPLDFTIDPTTSIFTATYKVGPTPTNQTVKTWPNLQYSGNLLATAEVDENTGELDTLEFTGGSMVTPNLNALLTTVVGTVPFTFTFTTNGITRYADSADVDPLTTGNPQGALHFTDFTSGTLSITNYPSIAPSLDFTAIVDFEKDRAYLIGPDIIFPTVLTTTPTSSNPLGRSFDVTLFSFIDMLRTALIGSAALQPNQFFQQEYSESGELYATASYTAFTPYGQWAIDNGLTLATGEEVNAAGMPYALLYAFDLPPDASSLPLTLSSTPEPTVELNLPNDGLAFTVQVEYSPDLTTPFTPLPDANFEDGTDSLDAGESNSATLSYPAGKQGYLRFFVTL